MALRPLAPKGFYAVPLVSEIKKRDLWTKELDDSLRKGVSAYGCNKRWWAISSDYMNGIRNGVQCRQRWNHLRRKNKNANDVPTMIESAQTLLAFTQTLAPLPPTQKVQVQEQVQEQLQEQDQEQDLEQNRIAKLQKKYDELKIKHHRNEQQLKRLMTRFEEGAKRNMRRKTRSSTCVDIDEQMNRFAEKIRGIPEDSMTACKRVVLETSKVEGWSVFAEDNFMKGDKILRYEGETISREESDRREEIYERTSSRTFFMMKADKKTVIDATITEHISRFVNHSCAPNAGLFLYLDIYLF